MWENTSGMGAFTVAFSAWAATSATAPADDGNLEPEVTAVASVADEGLVAAMAPRNIAGFRMEGDAEIEIVFGDIDRFKRHVDRFFSIDRKMREARRRFSRHVAAAVGLLAETPRGQRCPHELIGPHYYQAHLQGERFRALGSGFEREHAAIRRLHRHGDSAALTPDYRWKINRSRAIYSRSLTDYKEMRASFLDQLGAELAARGCARPTLLAVGRSAPAAEPEPAEAPFRAPNRRPRPGDKVTEASAIPATFFVDNQGCHRPMQVFLDGALVGSVEGSSRTAFQTTTGRHTLCLIESGSVKQCGDPGTVRSAYFYEGWSVALHCSE
jgi:hypothetical protein